MVEGGPAVANANDPAIHAMLMLGKEPSSGLADPSQSSAYAGVQAASSSMQMPATPASTAPAMMESSYMPHATLPPPQQHAPPMYFMPVVFHNVPIGASHVPQLAPPWHMAASHEAHYSVVPPGHWHMHPPGQYVGPHGAPVAAQPQPAHLPHQVHDPCHVSQHQVGSATAAPHEHGPYGLVAAASPAPWPMHAAGSYMAPQSETLAPGPAPPAHPSQQPHPQHLQHAATSNAPAPRDLEATPRRRAAARDCGSKGKHGWTREEDMKIVQYVQLAGQRWAVIAALLPGRTDDAVRNRYLRLLKRKMIEREEEAMHSTVVVTNQDLRECESVKKGDMWTEEEDSIIMDAVMRHGQKWQAISARIPGRSANAIRNRFLRCYSSSSSSKSAPIGSDVNVDPSI